MKLCPMCLKEFEKGVPTDYGTDDLFCSEKCKEHWYLMLDHERNFESDVVCPYCGHTHSDSWECDDDDEFVCNNCNRPFKMEVHTEITYTSTPHLDVLLKMKEEDDDGSD